MRPLRSTTPGRIVTLLAGLLIGKVTIEIVLNYVNYYPPNFGSEFLRGRAPYLFGPYRWAFYPHIVAGPITLLLGMILVSERFRLRFPGLHRLLGRIQVVCVLFLVAPSGLWMAFHAAAGPIGGLGLGTLAVATGFCVAMGWRSAIRQRFAAHRRWMWRTYLLLCSSVVLRLIGGSASVAGFAPDWLDPSAAWISWLAPLAIFESIELGRGRSRRTSREPLAGRSPINPAEMPRRRFPRL